MREAHKWKAAADPVLFVREAQLVSHLMDAIVSPVSSSDVAVIT